MSSTRGRRGRGGDEPVHWPLHLFVILMLILTIYPILWVLAIAFSGSQSLAIADLPVHPTALDRLRAILPWPKHVSIENFRSVFADQPFARWLLNSVIVAALTTFLGVFLACTSAYAFSRFRFPARRAGLMAFLVSQMFPGTLMLIPLYIIIVKWLGLGSTFTGLVLIYTVTAIPFCVWMMKGYFDTIPKELEESALIDGASQAMIFFRIVLPLAKPAVAVTALFSFMTAWNEFIQAATLMDRVDKYTVPVGLRFFVGGFTQQWGYFAAGSIVAAIPVMALFLFLQKYLVSGLTAGAVKG
ncbi:MAG: arabinogalactan oligomer / maltooligosaccharide transport system permease protein [Acidobacteriota bacterium]|jgi:arabinogalactan oligomer/maltooligosaccharide transport system permease protein|nr:arabinogalactan oligomer / maltooligosaccharide transport system permease protein [Acidobacteriota bacterium]